MVEDHQAGMAKHKCTDVFCLAFFLTFLGGMGYIMVYAFENGDTRRLTHGFNYQGMLCGVTVNVSNMPYLYWCGGDGPRIDGLPSSLNLEEPICVTECPTRAAPAQVFCPMPSQTVDSIVGIPPNIEIITTITRSIEAQDSYPTKDLAGRYCIPDVPHNGTLATSLTEGPGAPLASGGMQAMTALGGLRRVKPLIGGIAVGGIVLSFVYLFLLKKFAKPLVYSVLGFLSVGLLLLGAGCLITAFNLTGHQADSPIFKQYPYDTAVLYSQILGGTFAILGLIFTLVVLCAHKTIATACGCVEASCECIFALPSLLLQPIMESVTKLVLFVILIRGGMWLASCGEIHAHSATIGGQRVAGLKRSFTYTEDQQYMLFYYLFGYFWIMELFNAIGLFIVSYAVVLWYYSPMTNEGHKPAPRMALFRGIYNAFCHHLGTLAFGAFLVAAVRMIRVILAYIQKQAEASGNKLLATIMKVLQCVMDCFERFLKFINKNAYIDVAIRSTNFCEAAKHSFEFIFKEGASIAVLNGACFIFQAAGIMGISGSGGYLTYLMVTLNPRYTDDTSDHYVADPQFVAGVAMLLCMVISLSFMIIFDQCADTLLYTFLHNQKTDASSVSKYAPPVLAKVTGEYSAVSSAEPKEG